MVAASCMSVNNYELASYLCYIHCWVKLSADVTHGAHSVGKNSAHISEHEEICSLSTGDTMLEGDTTSLVTSLMNS